MLYSPPPPYVLLFARISTNSYGAFDAIVRNARLSIVSTYRSDPNTSYVAPTGVAMCTPVDGREIPDFGDGGHSPQMLNSLRRLLYGSTEKNTAVMRRASRRNFPSHSAAV